MAKVVAVGLSGGVDSSAAAVLLREAGYDVIGVTLRHLPPETVNSCCSLEAMVDARRVARKLGIPHYVVDVEAAFFERVIVPFEEAYLSGQTPNPCALCNRFIKFGALWEWAKSQGADYLATGHYARVIPRDDGYHLLRAKDRRKDQSYLLYSLTQDDLAHLVFPLGNLTKADSRQIAEAHGLVTAHKPDSQELCFVPANDYPRYLKEHRPDAVQPGDIVTTEGTVVGQHLGVAFYTVGQRRGLGIAGKTPHYVVRLDPERRQVVVGARDEVSHRTAYVSGVQYVQGRIPSGSLTGAVKVRYNMEPACAVWEPTATATAVVRFETPQWAIAPGQIAVLYQGDDLVAGGKIVRATAQ